MSVVTDFSFARKVASTSGRINSQRGDAMLSKISRRRFVGNTAAVSLCSLIPRFIGAAAGATRKITVRVDSEIGTVRPEFHGHFAEHLGSCVYGGLWVGKNSPIPNTNGYRQQAVEYLRELGIPVLRWPGGCGGWMRSVVYARRYERFSVYLRKYGGTDPFLIASGPNGNDTRWSRRFMDTLEGGTPEGVSMQYYEGGDDHPLHFTAEHVKKQLAIFSRVEEAIVQQRSLFDSYREGRKIALVLDEWGVWDRIAEEDEKKFGKLWQQSTMRGAVAAGLGLNIFNRQADKLYMCNIAQIVNVLQSLLLTDGPEGKQCVRTTTYHAFALFKGHRGKTAVKVESEGGAPDKDKASPDLSVSASTKNGVVVLSLVNPFPDQDL